MISEEKLKKELEGLHDFYCKELKQDDKRHDVALGGCEAVQAIYLLLYGIEVDNLIEKYWKACESEGE